MKKIVLIILSIVMSFFLYQCKTSMSAEEAYPLFDSIITGIEKNSRTFFDNTGNAEEILTNSINDAGYLSEKFTDFILYGNSHVIKHYYKAEIENTDIKDLLQSNPDFQSLSDNEKDEIYSIIDEIGEITVEAAQSQIVQAMQNLITYSARFLKENKNNPDIAYDKLAEMHLIYKDYETAKETLSEEVCEYLNIP